MWGLMAGFAAVAIVVCYFERKEIKRRERVEELMRRVR